MGFPPLNALNVQGKVFSPLKFNSEFDELKIMILLSDAKGLLF